MSNIIISPSDWGVATNRNIVFMPVSIRSKKQTREKQTLAMATFS